MPARRGDYIDTFICDGCGASRQFSFWEAAVNCGWTVARNPPAVKGLDHWFCPSCSAKEVPVSTDRSRVTRTCLCGEVATGVPQQFEDNGWTYRGAVWQCMKCSSQKEVPVAPSPSTVEQSKPVGYPSHEATRIALEMAGSCKDVTKTAIDREFVVLAEVVELLNPLNPAAIERIIGYLKSRYL